MPQPGKAIHTGAIQDFHYTNFEGIIEFRKLQILHLEYGTSPDHPEPQWLLYTFDTVKQSYRTFALSSLKPAQ